MQPGEYPARFIPELRAPCLGNAVQLPNGITAGAWQQCIRIRHSVVHDELAHAAGKDTGGVPRALLDVERCLCRRPWRRRVWRAFNAARMRGVLDLVAEKSGWGKRTLPKGTAQGVAFHFSIRAIRRGAEVSVSAQQNKVKVHKVFVSRRYRKSHHQPRCPAITWRRALVIDGPERADVAGNHTGARGVSYKQLDKHPMVRLTQAPRRSRSTGSRQHRRPAWENLR